MTPKQNAAAQQKNAHAHPQKKREMLITLDEKTAWVSPTQEPHTQETLWALRYARNDVAW